MTPTIPAGAIVRNMIGLQFRIISGGPWQYRAQAMTPNGAELVPIGRPITLGFSEIDQRLPLADEPLPGLAAVTREERPMPAIAEAPFTLTSEPATRRGHQAELFNALEDLTLRCDGAEGVRADGSNICTLAAHAALGDFDQDDEQDPRGIGHAIDFHE